ncbi:MAG: hypothetical protein KME42_18780 [Tildeniella nuda ZEHNDER 1965/U140]|jgi:hypothetical protein|nr:hypothetical protein [Tildeniella nuda ZEHNDER 1965/U140]
MQFSFSKASAVDVVEPTAQTRNGNATAAAHKSLHAIVSKTGSDQPAHLEAEQAARSELTQAEPLTVVKQTIDDLEAQGLLMLFDRHDQVAKRLTGDLIAAGVLPEDVLPQRILQESEPIAEPVSTNLKHAKETD